MLPITHIRRQHTLSLMIASVAVAALVACDHDVDADNAGDLPLSATESTTPPSASSSVGDNDRDEPTADQPADDDDSSDDGSGESADDQSGSSSQNGGDRDQPTGDCAAYANSSGWCQDGIGDYDCEGGSGNGPNYAPRPVEVISPGTDPFDLDRDNDGVGCEPHSEQTEPEPNPGPGTDPRFGTCREAIDNGYGPYYRGEDPEYDWYRDGDGDGIVCES